MNPFMYIDSPLETKGYACTLTEEYVSQQVLHDKAKTYDPVVQ